MIDIPTLDGEEWWESAAIDDTEGIIRQLVNLVDSCLKLGVNVVRANSLSNELSHNKSSQLTSLNVEDWLKFCDELSTTVLSKDANQFEANLRVFIQKYLPSKVIL